jgi:4-hydroxy-tetrahydrodipicolinate reductase
MTTLAIMGAGGRMGCALVRCVRAFDELKLAAAIEGSGHRAIGQDAGIVAGVDACGITVTDDVDGASSADVFIDFTFHDAVPGNAAFAAEHGRAIVIGTTGLSDDEAAHVRSAASKIPIVWAPNMSLGINLLFTLVEKAAAALGIEYDAEIVETHHRRKKDAPSGTALELARRVAKGRVQDLDEVACYGREGLVGERPQGEIGIHALRVGDVVGEHTVTLGTESERIELIHRASSRDAFAVGALRAARWVAGRDPGMYDMTDVLGL